MIEEERLQLEQDLAMARELNKRWNAEGLVKQINDRYTFLLHLEKSAEVVASWPEWKRKLINFI